jgi:hypothetical protein
MNIDKIEGADEKRKALREILEAASRNNPDPEAIGKLKEWLAISPDLWRYFADVEKTMQSGIIKRLHGSQLGKIAAQKGAEQVRDDLGYDHAPRLERLLIEHAVTCWLRLQDVGVNYDRVIVERMPIPLIDCWERRLSAAQRRFLRAAEALVRVRRIIRITPALQVNIAMEGGQQVNIVR